MKKKLLSKGFEVELFTGLPSGEHVGVSAGVKRDLPEFVIEPDHRNLEYITVPEFSYLPLKEALLAPRRRLRKWLLEKNLTLLPGSTLSLGNSKCFERSDLLNPYHDFIEANYGTRVVTASIHINLGIKDLSLLFAAIRLVRCEAALFLAMSASSPFLDGIATGAHSQRWLQFPLTPENVPLFVNHDHYVEWVERHLESGHMLNERHLWTSVRPNGPRRPYELNRLELRICDLITNPEILLAVTAFLEVRVLSLLHNPDQLDPLRVSTLTPHELSVLSDTNDANAAKKSFDANLQHWRDGRPILCRTWIEELLDEVRPLAMELGLLERLAPLQDVLIKGNQAMHWLKAFSSGMPVSEILQEGIVCMNAEESSVSKPGVILG